MLLGVAAAAGVQPAVAQEPPPSPPVTIAMAPDGDLVDDQTVTVSGTAPDREWLLVVQCPADAATTSDCDTDVAGWAEPGAGGSYSVELRVRMVISSWSGTVTDCRAAPGCVLAAFDGQSAIGDTPQVPIAFDPDAEPLPAPTLTVEPAADLVHGQEATLAGNGFEPGTHPWVMQCAPGVDSACRDLAGVTVADDGTFTTTVVVAARFVTWSGEAIDCRTAVPNCELVATTSSTTSTRAGRVALAFDPEGPLPPPPAITAEPASAIVDPSTITVRGTDFSPHGWVSVALCRDDGPDSWACEAETRTDVTADAAGGFVTTLDVASAFSHGDLTAELVDCRRDPGCAIVARDELAAETARDHVTFGPLAPGRGRYRDPVFPEVDISHDVVYRQTTQIDGTTVDLQMDIFQPAGDTATRRPVALGMHGGFFIFGNEDQLAASSFEYARRGYVAVSISYRLRPQMSTSDIPGQIEASYDAYDDALAAVQWLRDHAEAYRLDPDTIIAGGYSAGGALAFHFAYLPGERGPETPVVAAALPMAGANIGVPQAGAPPVLAQHGEYDTTLSIDNPRAACEQARAVGNVCDLVEFPGEGHIISQRRALLANSVDFVDEHVLQPRGYFDVPADAGPDATVVEGSTTVVGTADPDGADGALTYSWSPADHLDDPTVADPAHTYAEPGRYQVVVSVADDDGATATWDEPVTVGCARVGTDGDDVLVGLWPDDVICGLGGDDVVIGLFGDDALYGGAGDDLLLGGQGDDTLAGGAGDDLLLGGQGDDSLDGGAGLDRAWGGPGRDTCTAETTRAC